MVRDLEIILKTTIPSLLNSCTSPKGCRFVSSVSHAAQLNFTGLLTGTKKSISLILASLQWLHEIHDFQIFI